MKSANWILILNLLVVSWVDCGEVDVSGNDAFLNGTDYMKDTLDDMMEYRG